MKRFFKILAIVLAIGALAQTVALAKAKSGNASDSSSKSQGSDGPGV